MLFSSFSLFYIPTFYLYFFACCYCGSAILYCYSTFYHLYCCSVHHDTDVLHLHLCMPCYHILCCVVVGPTKTWVHLLWLLLLHLTRVCRYCTWPAYLFYACMMQIFFAIAFATVDVFIATFYYHSAVSLFCSTFYLPGDHSFMLVHLSLPGLYHMLCLLKPCRPCTTPAIPSLPDTYYTIPCVPIPMLYISFLSLLLHYSLSFESFSFQFFYISFIYSSILYFLTLLLCVTYTSVPV